MPRQLQCEADDHILMAVDDGIFGLYVCNALPAAQDVQDGITRPARLAMVGSPLLGIC